MEQSKDMKLLLCSFEKEFGLKINFLKSELFCYGYTDLFVCGLGHYPF
jgi:hypothetical protein